MRFPLSSLRPGPASGVLAAVSWGPGVLARPAADLRFNVSTLRKGRSPLLKWGCFPLPLSDAVRRFANQYLAFLLIYYGQQKMKLEKGKGNPALVGLTVHPWERGGVICIVNATLPWRGTELGWNSDLIPLSI